MGHRTIVGRRYFTDNRMTKHLWHIIIFFAPVLMSFKVTPPSVPSAGVVEREIEREYESQPFSIYKQMPPLQIDIPEECLDLPEGATVFIEKVRLYGNGTFCQEELLSCISDQMNHNHTIKSIYGLCSAIDRFYASKGYFLARTYPPEQDIDNGELILEVIEGKLGTVRVIGNKHYDVRFICSYFEKLIGRSLQYDQFIRALLLLNDNMDLVAGAVFSKGATFGTGDVTLYVNDEYPAHLYLNGNNFGRDLTTNSRVGARLDWGNFFTDGDRFSIAEVVGFPVDALYFTDINYTIPINRNGTFLELEYLSSRFDIEELERLHLRGRSDIATIGVSQAVIRRRSLSVNCFAYLDIKQIQNFALCHRTSYDKLRVLTFGGTVDHFNPCCSRDYLTLQMSAGIPNFLGGLKPIDRECSRMGGGGQFVHLNADYDRLQWIAPNYFFYFHASGQWSPNRLPLAEQIYIGGADTVRGYPLAVALGDSGFYANFEYRFPVPYVDQYRFFNTGLVWGDVLQFDTFLDYGGVMLKSGRDTYLCGTGFGFTLLGPYTIALSIDLGFPLTERKLTESAFLYIKITAQPF